VVNVLDVLPLQILQPLDIWLRVFAHRKNTNPAPAAASAITIEVQLVFKLVNAKGFDCCLTAAPVAPAALAPVVEVSLDCDREPSPETVGDAVATPDAAFVPVAGTVLSGLEVPVTVILPVGTPSAIPDAIARALRVGKGASALTDQPPAVKSGHLGALVVIVAA
jgi:hypothetical protein